MPLTEPGSRLERTAARGGPELHLKAARAMERSRALLRPVDSTGRAGREFSPAMRLGRPTKAFKSHCTASTYCLPATGNNGVLSSGDAGITFSLTGLLTTPLRITSITAINREPSWPRLQVDLLGTDVSDRRGAAINPHAAAIESRRSAIALEVASVKAGARCSLVGRHLSRPAMPD